MAELKTKPTNASVADFLAAVSDEERREDCRRVAKIMEKVTGAKARMWGPSIVGFGDRRYKGASGRTDWFIVGFSPRKKNLTVYIMGLARYKELLELLGKHKTSGGGCLYINRLADVDTDVLQKLIRRSVADLGSDP
jgi:hypothetical protein